MRHYYAHGWHPEYDVWALYAFETRKDRDAFCAVANAAPISYDKARHKYIRPWRKQFELRRYREHDPYTHELTLDYGRVLTLLEL